MLLGLPSHSRCIARSHWQSAVRSRVATSRNVRYTPPQDVEHVEFGNDFILSILRSNPSLRDTKSYLQSFGPKPSPARPEVQQPLLPPELWSMTQMLKPEITTPSVDAKPDSPIVASILDPVYKRTALVKMQGPFTDRQLDSIARGMVYLEKLGLVSIIVVERDDWQRGTEGERQQVVDECMRVAHALEQQGAKARPMIDTLVRLGPKPGDEDAARDADMAVPRRPPEAHALPRDLVPLRSALRAGEIPVLPPLVLDSLCRSVRVDSNDVVAALVRGLVEAADSAPRAIGEMDLTPLRLMIINREGGIPSYARSGLPHLLVNISSEYDFITNTFESSWNSSHPKSLGNLTLARTCLAYMPPTASAVMVSHRSPKSLIANLITNKPALSSSLPHALLQSTGKLTPDTPTLIRRGLPIRVVRELDALDQDKLTALLEASFGRTLDTRAFFARLADRLDYAIVAGDYAGAAIVTREGAARDVQYLDKFAVHPAHQGDGAVDFLWVALHDESFGLGLPYSVNPNGGRQGEGAPAPLVWRSRADNPINRWYFERASGHLRMGRWVLFWCDAEARVRAAVQRRIDAGDGQGRRALLLEEEDRGRIPHWAAVAQEIPSSWSA